MQLSEKQLEVVNHIYGAALCIAGPGSGKTAVIINRVKMLIEQGVRPSEILVVTFAKAAAESMKSRFYEISGVTGVRFSTIHSLCYHIINISNAAKASLIPDKVKKGWFLKLLSENLGCNFSGEGHLRDTCMEISRFKACLDEKEILRETSWQKLLDDYETHFTDKAHFKYIYTRYKRFLEQNLYYDFDDMTSMARRRLAYDPDIKTGLGFKFLMIDEFQDTSLSQLYLLKDLSYNDNVFAVGDDDQAIFSFRGSRPGIFDSFSCLFANHRLFILKENYRCCNSIIAAANSLICENKSRFTKEIISEYNSCDTKSGVTINRYKTRYDELRGIFDYLRSDAEDEKSFCVLTRTNYEAELVCSFFKHMGITFHSALKAKDPFNHPGINIILSYMRLCADTAGLQDFVNVFKLSGFPLSGQSVYACLGSCAQETIKRLYKYSEGNTLLKQGLDDMRIRVELLRKLTPAMQVMFVRRTCGLDSYYKNKCLFSGAEYELIQERLEAFFEFAKGFSTTKSLLSFMCSLEETEPSREDIIKENIIKVRVMTLHASKGLEFDYVWIINVNEGIIPFKKAVEKGLIEEERRLLYVGMTRAKDRLFLSCHSSAGSKKTPESSFLSELA